MQTLFYKVYLINIWIYNYTYLIDSATNHMLYLIV
ncbi:hypothetical protein M2175_001138 [Bradyrhizobium elkanii]|nr:hypothetical protein [Bradyrhizobium elkanii]MCS3966659.1 hypothetical protein [Bradyrhizobium japonicum]